MAVGLDKKTSTLATLHRHLQINYYYLSILMQSGIEKTIAMAISTSTELTNTTTTTTSVPKERERHVGVHSKIKFTGKSSLVLKSNRTFQLDKQT